MFKSLIAAAAIATTAVVATAPAEAKTKIDVDLVFGVGAPVYGDDYYDYPVYPVRPHHPRRPVVVVDYDDGISCRQGRRVLRRNGFHGIEAFDCSAPVFGYTAWRGDRMFRVKVSTDGDIISARRARY